MNTRPFLNRVCLFIVCFVIAIHVDAQTTLDPGDLVFISYNSETTEEDRFSVVLLKDVSNGTEIFFTDLGWTGSEFQGTPTTCGANMGAQSDGVIKWTANSAIDCGSEIYFSATTNLTVNIGTVEGVQATFSDPTKYINLPAGGDQILAYQGSFASPSFIAGISMDSDPWQAPTVCQSTNSDSALPAAISAYGFTIQPEADNAKYDCSINSGSIGSLQSAILDDGNWDIDQSAQFPLPINCSFVCNTDAPIITMQPADQEICPNMNASFSVTASNAIGYQWEVDTGSGFVNASGAIYSGATTANLTVTQIAGLSGASFRCQVLGTSGNSTSASATLTEWFNPSITLEPVDAISCIGCTSGFYLEANGDGLAYQWMISTGGAYTTLTNNATYDGVNTNKLIINNITNAIDLANFKCEVSGACTPTIESSPRSLSLTGANTSLVAGDVAFLAYNVDDVDVPEEDNFSFVLLSDIEGGTEINITDYGWTDTEEFHNVCASTASSDGIIKWVSNADLNCGTEIFINGKSKLNANIGLVIGTQSTLSNAELYLTFSSGGDQLFAYQGAHDSPTLLSGIFFADDAGWSTSYTCAESTSTKSVLPAALSSGFSAIAITPEVDNAKYNCTINSGSTASIRTAIMTVANWDVDNSTSFVLPVNCGIGCNESAPNITSQPISVVVCDGLSASFSVSAANALTYQWQIETLVGWDDIINDGNYSGAQSTTLSVVNVTGLSGSNYRCIVGNSMGTSTSQQADLLVLFSPTIIEQPRNAESCVGCYSGYQVEVDGDGLLYQWQVSISGAAFTNVVDNALYSGSQSNILKLSAIPSNADNNTYRCIITGDCTPQVTSNTAGLSLSGSNEILAEGDLAFASFNADADEDNFSLILLKSISGGTEINITDFGWTNDNAFQNCAGAGNSDGIIKWIATESYACGTEINIEGKQSLSASKGVVFGTQSTFSDNTLYINITSSGDQLFAYQGLHTSPTLITGMYNASSTGWDASLPNCEGTSTKSVLPAALTTGYSAMQFAPEMDNIRFDCTAATTSGDIDGIRTALHEPSNWLGNNDTPLAEPIDCSFACCAVTNPITIYVDVQTTGTKDGSSWSNAFSSLQDALDAARSCGIPSSIKIANGTYFPDAGLTVNAGNRFEPFVIDFITSLEGGYNASTGLKDYSGRTILSGNLSNPSLITDNSQRVVEVLAAATLSDLTVEGAYNDSNSEFQGGGIYATDGIFKNMIIRYNDIVVGSGIGGGMYVTGNAVQLENVLIHNNTAINYGGGISIENAVGNNTFKNVTIADNAANANAGIDNFNVNIDLFNTIMYHNAASDITVFGSTVITANHCILETSTVWSGTQNSNQDPSFVNKDHDNYQISECGIAYEMGNSANAPSSSLDLNGNARIKLGQIDIGAYEVQSITPRSQITPLIDGSLVYCTPQILDIVIPNSNPNVEYMLYKPELDATVVGDGTDLNLMSSANAATQDYLVTGSRTGASKLSFADNKRITVPYESEIALTADEDFILEVGVNFNTIGGVKRFYSQEGSIGIGVWGDEILITRYTIVDISTIGVDLTPNTDYIIKVEQRVIGPDEVQLLVSLDGELKWTGTSTTNYIANTGDINIGGRPTLQWIDGDMDFIEIRKGNQIELRYDFTTGNDSEVVYDYRFLDDGESPRNGTMVGFTPATDWVTGTDVFANLCVEEATYDVKVATIPLNHYVDNPNFAGPGSLAYLTANSCPNDTIRFDPIVDNVPLVFLGLVTTPHDINYIGNGTDKTIFDGNSDPSYPIFNIPAAHKILMKNLQIKDAVESVVGSFYVSGDHTLENLLFKGYTIGQEPFRVDGLSVLKIVGEVRIEE